MVENALFIFSPFSSTRFNNLAELPRLERWFRSDANPSRQKLNSYMNILNNSAYRRTNNKVTYQQICNWFANQRASNRNSSRPSSQASNRSASFIAPQTNNALALMAAAAAAVASNGNGQNNNTQNGLNLSQNFTSLLSGFSVSSNSIQQNNTVSTSTGSQIPVSCLPMDIRSKFSASNGYNPLMDRQSDGEVWNKVCYYFNIKIII